MNKKYEQESCANRCTDLDHWLCGAPFCGSDEVRALEISKTSDHFLRTVFIFPGLLNDFSDDNWIQHMCHSSFRKSYTICGTAMNIVCWHLCINVLYFEMNTYVFEK